MGIGAHISGGWDIPWSAIYKLEKEESWWYNSVGAWRSEKLGERWLRWTTASPKAVQPGTPTFQQEETARSEKTENLPLLCLVLLRHSRLCVRACGRQWSGCLTSHWWRQIYSTHSTDSNIALLEKPLQTHPEIQPYMLFGYASARKLTHNINHNIQVKYTVKTSIP